MQDPLELGAARRRFRRFVRRRGNGCWQWQGATSRKHSARYGEFWFNGRMHGAHRMAHLLFIGEIPPKREIHHVCANPLCVNPSHLQAVPQRKNGYLARRHRRGTLA